MRVHAGRPWERAAQRVAAATVACIDQLLEHTRKDTSLALFEVVLPAVKRHSSGSGSGGANSGAGLRSALLLAVLAHMIEFHRGARVPDWQAAADAVAAAAGCAVAKPPARAMEQLGGGNVAAAGAHLRVTCSGETPLAEDFEGVSASGQARFLLLWLFKRPRSPVIGNFFIA